LHNLTLTFSEPFDGAVSAHGNFTLAPLPGNSPEVNDQGGSFVYDGGSPGDVTMLFGKLEFTGRVTLAPLADGDESFRHGTIVIDQTILGERVHVTYAR